MDDWEKKYYQKKMNQMGGGSNNVPSSNIPQNPYSNMSREIDIGDALLKRIAAQQGGLPSHLIGTNLTTTQAQQQAASNPNGIREVALRPGYKIYTQVQTGGFGPSIPVIKEHGAIPTNMVERVMFKRKVKGYLLEGNSVVDFSRIGERLDLMQEFCVIEIGLVGTFLVKEEAIQEQGSHGRTLLRG